jgi:predicted NACHT family NTPase
MTGFEAAAIAVLSPLAQKALEKGAEKIGEIVMQSAWDGGGKFFGMFERKATAGTKGLVFAAARQYVQNYAERHGQLKVLGMREPVSLESIYTAVRFLGDDIRQYASVEDLETAYRSSMTRRFQSNKCEKQDGLKVANAKQFLMVLGQPGAGKSTFLRRIGLAALKGEYGHKCVPVFIELKRFTTSEIDLEKVIALELKACGFPKPEVSTAELLRQGQLLVLLDGLDEVQNDQLDIAIQKIEDFVDRYSKNRFIASCRIAAYRSYFTRFSDVIMADFDDEQIQKFIQNWFSATQDRQFDVAKRCWELLQQQEYQSAKELAQTPLLLTFRNYSG